ncbi:MAG: (Fe-S)-binding protein [Deltaproteobacteria bacterium]|nr:(Fe-S)-binding protein [Deltaproteobacteria bacterium]
MEEKKPPRKVSLFIPCLVEHFLPHVGEATATILARIGIDLDYPGGQTCCGQMQFKAGYQSEARKMARHFIRVFKDAEMVVSPSGSCVGMVRHHYRELFRDDAAWLSRAESLGKKTFELTEFLVDVLGIQDVGAEWPGKAVYHDSCQVSRVLGVREQPRMLLFNVRRLHLVEMAHQETCCGFGGIFSLEFPVVSEKMTGDKVAEVVKSGAEFVISAEPSCLLNIGGYLAKMGEKIRALHIAEVLARISRQ